MASSSNLPFYDRVSGDGVYPLSPPAKVYNIAKSAKCLALEAKLRRFIEEDCIPAERVAAEQARHLASRWEQVPVLEDLKEKARALGLWNLFLPKKYPEGAGLSNLEYAHLCEIMGMCMLCPEACNCSAPDTGNMEVIAKYGTAEQKRKWLTPLREGRIRSAFLMTEPAVASSDATNICTTITRDGNHYVINGRKWWSSGALDKRCKICVVMGKTNPNASKWAQQSMILMPLDAPGVTIVRPLTVFGYDDAPHGHAEVLLENVRVPVDHLLLGEGRGFEISQGRLGPGRIHHCMRSIGVAERALQLMVKRVQVRSTFGKTLAEHGTIQRDIANSRMEIDQSRLMVLNAAAAIDEIGGKGARKEIAMIKIVVPNMALQVVDRAIQAHGGCGVCQDTPLAYLWAQIRTLRLADGPDEVHARTIARLEMRRPDCKPPTARL